MLRNYIKIALRNLWRGGQFSLINIGGLALGITVFLFIMQYVAFEWSANRFHKNFKELYRANVQYKDGKTDYYLPPGFAPVIKQNVPGIENYVRVAEGIGGGVITFTPSKQTDTKTFREDAMIYVEGRFLEVFSFPLVAGNVTLNNPKTLALSEPMSRKLFGAANSVGETVMVSNQFGNTPYTVTAVYQVPENSDIKAEVLLSLHTLESAAN
ncbi:MAG TPA: ABC transporter permease, partial [Flavisolibacter sp.]|nr:ABC transporter permease [Flavisolibacter sp.]